MPNSNLPLVSICTVAASLASAAGWRKSLSSTNVPTVSWVVTAAAAITAGKGASCLPKWSATNSVEYPWSSALRANSRHSAPVSARLANSPKRIRRLTAVTPMPRGPRRMPRRRSVGERCGGARPFRIGNEPRAQVFSGIPPVRVARQHDTAAALAIDLGRVNSGWDGPMVLQGAGDLDHPPPRPNDQRVSRAQVLRGAVEDGPHALSHGHVLLANARNTRVALPRALCCAIDQVVISHVLDHVEPAIPNGGVRLEPLTRSRRWRPPLGTTPFHRQFLRVHEPVADFPVQRVLVVHGHIRGEARLLTHHTGRDHGVEGKQHVRDAPVIRVLTSRPPRTVGRAIRRIDNDEPRRRIRGDEVVEGARDSVLNPGSARVQKGLMHRIHLAFPALHPVARPVNDRDDLVLKTKHVRFEIGQRRRHRARPHVGPDDPVPLARRIGDRLDFGLEVRLGRLVRHVDALAAHAELPAVIDAPQPFFLAPTEEQRSATMRAIVLYQSDLASRNPEPDQILA